MPVIHARFADFDHGDENGPCGYSICVSEMGIESEDRHHVRVIDESRFGGGSELAYTGICDESCCKLPRKLGPVIMQMLRDPGRKPIILPEE